MDRSLKELIREYESDWESMDRDSLLSLIDDIISQLQKESKYQKVQKRI